MPSSQKQLVATLDRAVKVSDIERVILPVPSWLDSSVIPVSGCRARGWEFDSPHCASWEQSQPAWPWGQAAQSQNARRRREWQTTSMYSLPGKPWKGLPLVSFDLRAHYGDGIIAETNEIFFLSFLFTVCKCLKTRILSEYKMFLFHSQRPCSLTWKRV